MPIPLETIEDEEWQEEGFFVRITVRPDEIENEEVYQLAERVVAALRYKPPVPPGQAFADAIAKIACKRCKGKGKWFDCEDEEMLRCPACSGTGLKD